MKLYAASRVAAVYNFDESVILLNLQTGRRVYLSSVAGTVWRYLTAALDLEQALNATAMEYGVALEILQADVQLAVDTLQAHQMLADVQPSGSCSNVVASVRCGSSNQGEAAVSMVDTAVQPAIGTRYQLAGFIATAIARVLLLLPFRWLLKIMLVIRRCMPRSCSSEEAYNLVRAVRRPARWYLGQSACRELSVAAFLAGAIFGRPPDWCLGSQFGPIIHHAWIEVDQVPVDEPEMMGVPYGIHIRV
jgi:hypothetical protein